MIDYVFDFLGYVYSILAGLGAYAFEIEFGEAIDTSWTGNIAPILISQGNPFNEWVFNIPKPSGGVIIDVITWLVTKLPFINSLLDYPVWIGMFVLFVTLSVLVGLVTFVKNLLI